MTQKTLREQYLAHLRNKDVTAISFNGFQLNGNLLQFDCSDLILSTTHYGQRPKEVLCENFLAVIPYTQPRNMSYKMRSDTSTVRQNYLQHLEDKQISCIVANGFRLTGILVAYDEQDIIVATTRYGDLKHVLVTGFSTVLPED